QKVYNADAACALPAVLTQMLVDSVPPGERRLGRIDLLPAVPAFLAAGRLTGVRTLTRVQLTELRWDLAAGYAAAVLTSDTDQEVELSWAGAASRVIPLSGGQAARVVLDDGVKRFDWGRSDANTR